MTVTAPPRSPRFDAPSELDPLQALIEEARRRTRRRRRRFAGATLLAAAAVAAGFAGLGPRGAEHAPPPARERPPQIALGPRGVENGPLTLNDVETIRPGEGPVGWYAASTLGPDGRLHALARCPNGADWCGEVESVDWSPDGVWLALGVSSVGSANPYNGLHLINPATGEDRLIRHCQAFGGECDWFDIDWAPDGSKLAYVANDDIVVINSDGTGRRVVVDGVYRRARSPSWSPDSAWLAFATRSNGQSAVDVIRADGRDLRLVVDGGSAPAWSPDGTTIAYRTSCGIRLITLEGEDATPPTPSRCRHAIGIGGRPAWSPDGTKLAIGSAGPKTFGAGGPVRGTFVMNADGSDLALVTTKTQAVYMGSDPRPAWRPRPPARRG